MKNIVHLPRNAGKSYIQKLQEEHEKDFNVIKGYKKLYYSGSFYDDHFEDNKLMVDNNLIFTNDHHTAYKTKVRHLLNCFFSEVREGFKVTYGCKYCRHKQQILDANIVYTQFIKKKITSFADIRVYCGNCQSSCVIPTRAFIKNVLSNYTQEPTQEFNLSLIKLVDKLNQLFKFDCMLNGNDSIIIESNNLQDLIYD